jgi:hypothetical protein
VTDSGPEGRHQASLAGAQQNIALVPLLVSRQPAVPKAEAEPLDDASHRAAQAVGAEEVVPPGTAIKEGLPLSELLPGARQITTSAGSWEKALRIAGLDVPVSGAQPGLPIVEAIELCVGALGGLPSENLLRRFARVNAISVCGRGKKRWHEFVAEYLARGEAGDGAVPSVRIGDKGQPLPLLPESVRSGLPSARGLKPWDEESCIEGLRLYDAALDSSDKRSLQHYQSWSKGRDACPSTGVLGRVFGKNYWSRAFGEAQRRNREEAGRKAA